MDKEQVRRSALQRLSTIKGHITGIEKMVEENKSCEEVLFQLSAVLGAMHKLTAYILEGYSEVCLHGVNIEDPVARQRVVDVIRMMISMLKKN